MLVVAGFSPVRYTHLFANVFDFISCDMQIAGFITLFQSLNDEVDLTQPDTRWGSFGLGW